MMSKILTLEPLTDECKFANTKRSNRLPAIAANLVRHAAMCRLQPSHFILIFNMFAVILLPTRKQTC